MWIALAIVGVILLLVVAGVVWYFISSRQIREWEQRIEEEGDLLLCWIARADEALYEEADVPGYAEVRVVFSPTKMPDLEDQLKEAARRLTKGDLVDHDVDPDKIDPFYEKVKDLRWLHPPLRIPKWLVGDIKAYTAVVPVYWRRLPKMRLTLPYLYCHCLLGENGGVVQADYPGTRRTRAAERD